MLHLTKKYLNELYQPFVGNRKIQATCFLPQNFSNREWDGTPEPNDLSVLGAPLQVKSRDLKIRQLFDVADKRGQLPPLPCPRKGPRVGHVSWNGHLKQTKSSFWALIVNRPWPRRLRSRIFSIIIRSLVIPVLHSLALN